MKRFIYTLVGLFMLCSTGMAEDIVLPKLKAQQQPQTQVVIPKLKNTERRPISQEKDVPPAAPLAFPKTIGKWPKLTVVLERQKCAALLKGLDMQFNAIEPLGDDNGCGAAAPVVISNIQGIAIQPAAEANCEMAEALYHWVTTSVKPAARQHFKKDLAVIGNASAYVCRRRNNSRTGKLSEHAKANALDISTLGFADGTKVTIKGDWGGIRQKIGLAPQGNFLRRIRNDACIRFTTVLGPGSDPFHGDHFHVDRAQRKSGYRICK